MLCQWRNQSQNMENLTNFITYNIWQLIIYIFIYFLVYICHINLGFHSCSLCVLFVKTARLTLLKWLVWLSIERNWMGWLTEDLLSYKNRTVAYIGNTSLETAVNVWHQKASLKPADCQIIAYILCGVRNNNCLVTKQVPRKDSHKSILSIKAIEQSDSIFLET